MNRKKVIAALASVAALASLAACGGVKDGGAATGNTITVGTTDKITSLDPAGSYDNGSYAVQIQVFPFLYAQNYNTSELSPDIAADNGTWSADGTEFTVKLKKGLKFANGHDLTASDVKFSFDRIKKINDENGPSSLLANIESVEAKDDTTVVFHSAVKDDVTLKQALSSPAGPIVDEESFSADKLTDANTIVKDNAFAGPYKLTSYKVNEALAYAKNDSYKGLTPAKNDVVQVKYFADSSNLKMAVQQGQTLPPVKGLALYPQLLKVADYVRLYTFQTGTGGGHIFSGDAKGDVLGPFDTVVAFGDLVFQHPRVFRADAVEAVIRLGDIHLVAAPGAAANCQNNSATNSSHRKWPSDPRRTQRNS